MNGWILSLLIMLGGVVAYVLLWAILELLKKVIFRAMDKADEEDRAEFATWLAEQTKRRIAQRDHPDEGLTTTD